MWNVDSIAKHLWKEFPSKNWSLRGLNKLLKKINKNRLFNDCKVEMGRMSDYDIRLKPKVWAGLPNECRTFGRTSETTSFTGERTDWPGNVVVSKHVRTHTSSKMANYVEKLQHIIYEQKLLISKLMLFIKLTGGPFLRTVF